MNRNMKFIVAYKLGLLGDDILTTYFSFLANLINDKKLQEITDIEVSSLFNETYGIELPRTFVRQILTVGVNNGAIKKRKGKYIINFDEISKYIFDNNEYATLFNKLKINYEKFCNDNNYKEKIDNDIILNLINSEETEEFLIDNSQEQTKSVYRSWFYFLIYCHENNEELYNFVTSLYLSNVVTEALFYSSKQKYDLSNVTIYLDSPMIFGILGMDINERVESYTMLFNNLKNLNCNICLFKHNYEEIEGIMQNSLYWAFNINYDLLKANNVTKHFHDKYKNRQEVEEIIYDLQDIIIEKGISIVTCEVDKKYCEDEQKLFEMIKDKYKENPQIDIAEKEHSIFIDVKSINLIYSLRAGNLIKSLENCKYLLLTTNNVIASVSKKYHNSLKHYNFFPVCISLDLLGTILWLNSSFKILDFYKSKILADSYEYLKPSKNIIENFFEVLQKAKDDHKISETKFLILRNNSIIERALTNICKDNYLSFEYKSYDEVYDEIEAMANKKFIEESKAHTLTKETLNKKEKEIELLKNEIEEKNNKFKIERRNKRIEKIEKFQKKVNRLEIIISIMLFICGYIPLSLLSFFFTPSNIEFNLKSILPACCFVCYSFFLSLFINTYKNLSKIIVRKIRKRCVKIKSKKLFY